MRNQNIDQLIVYCASLILAHYILQFIVPFLFLSLVVLIVVKIWLRK